MPLSPTLSPRGEGELPAFRRAVAAVALAGWVILAGCGGPEPEAKPVKHVRTHWDMLLERRSIPELEELLEERLTLLRESRGERPRKRKSA